MRKVKTFKETEVKLMAEDAPLEVPEMIEMQEIHCHDCNKWIRFPIDLNKNGNHVINCPNCGHEHCRVVKDGEITDIRWDSRNGRTWHTAVSSTSSTSISGSFAGRAWLASSSTGTSSTIYNIS